LAGDTLRSYADLRVPIIGVTLLYDKGYFFQKLDERGNQSESPVQWEPQTFLRPLPERIELQIRGRSVAVKAWQYDVVGATGYLVSVIFLDVNLEENTDSDRELTTYLYGGDEEYRLAQEIVLGIGGIKMLRKLGYTEIKKYHMNEGHPSLLTIELLKESCRKGNEENCDFEGVRRSCVFTTHTSVSAAYDLFPYELVKRLLGEYLPTEIIQMLGGNEKLNMALLAWT